MDFFDDAVEVGGPDERCGALVVLGEVAVDGGLSDGRPGWKRQCASATAWSRRNLTDCFRRERRPDSVAGLSGSALLPALSRATVASLGRDEKSTSTLAIAGRGAPPRWYCRPARGPNQDRVEDCAPACSSSRILQATSTVICMVRRSIATNCRGRNGGCEPPPHRSRRALLP